MCAAPAGDDDELLARVASGDSAAAGILFDRHKQALWTIAMGMLRNYHDVEEAVQETFFKMIRGAHTYSRSGTFKGWLVSILKNECINIAKQRNRQPVPLSPEQLQGLVRAVSAMDEDQVMVWRAVEMLPQPQQEVMWLQDVAGCTAKETAAYLGLTLAEYRKLRDAGIRALRRLLGHR